MADSPATVTESKRSHADAFESRDTSPSDNFVIGNVSLLEGSPTYKQRRKQATPFSRRNSKPKPSLGFDGWETTAVNMEAHASPAAHPYTFAYRSPNSSLFSLSSSNVSAHSSPMPSDAGMTRGSIVDGLTSRNSVGSAKTAMYAQNAWR